jgi:BolA protein
MTGNRQDLIREELEKHFQPTELLIKDQSQLHAGHEGARDGKGHFDVTIVSKAFDGINRIQRHRMVYDADGINRIQRHRMVYDALSKLIETDIHALRIKAFAPSER